jgi:CrcB protein
MLVWVGVGLLGGVGALLRFTIDGVVAARLGAGFPYGTFVVNVSGAFVLGLLTGVVLSGDQLLLWGTALIGSYTTFSTWMFETHRLGEGRQEAALWLNVALSLAVGLGAAALGRALGGAF